MKKFKNKNKPSNRTEDTARKIGAGRGAQQDIVLNPAGRALEEGVQEVPLHRLHPRCPDPRDGFQPLTGYLLYRLSSLVKKYLERLGRSVDLCYWMKITKSLLSSSAPGVQVVPAQAGSGKSTWVLAFLLSLCEFAGSNPQETRSLGGVLLVVQKVETLNQLREQICEILGEKAGERMVPLQSLTPSGKALGLCPNPQVEDCRQCAADRCAYAGECPLKALEESSRSAYVLGVTQARFYAMRQNDLLDQLLLRELEGEQPLPRRWVIFDEKPDLVQINALSTGLVNSLSNHFEELVAQKRLTDQRACSIQSGLGYHVNRPLQELRRSTVIARPGQPPKDELAGLCALSPKEEERADYIKFRAGLESRRDLMNADLRACFQVIDRLYQGGDCLFCKACGCHLTTVQDGMRELRGQQTLIFDATALVDGDYQRQTYMELLPVQDLRNTELVTFHIFRNKQLNVSKTGIKRPGIAVGLCALIEEILEKHPQPTFLCVYKELSDFFAQNISQELRQYIRFMPGQDPPKVPYFGGTNGSNDFRQCRNVILLGYPRLDPEAYLERTYAAWRDHGFREELLRTQEFMRNQAQPWKGGLRSLPSVAEYEARHLTARMEQEIYRCALRNAQVAGEIHVFLFYPPEQMWKLMKDRFPGCRVDEIEEVPDCMLPYLGSGRTYRGKKTAFTLVQDFLARWDGNPIGITQLRQQLGISPSAWKELQAQDRFRGLLLHYQAQLAGRGKHAKLRRWSDSQEELPA